MLCLALNAFRVPKGANFGSERCEFWFRKVRTGTVLWMVPDSAIFSVPEQAKIVYHVAHEPAS